MSLAREIVVGAISQLLAIMGAERLTNRSGRIVVPLSLLEESIATHGNLVHSNVELVRTLRDAIAVLERDHKILIVEAPNIAIEVTQEFLEWDRQSDLDDLPTDAASIVDTFSPIETQTGDYRPGAGRDRFRQAMRSAYPDSDLSFES